MNLRELEIIHDHSTANRSEIERSVECRCFYCLATFPANTITEWIEDKSGDTAVCPKCGIDSVIGSAAGIPMTDLIFEEMQSHWFS